jgi:hypothetical protein
MKETAILERVVSLVLVVVVVVVGNGRTFTIFSPVIVEV